MENYRFLSAIFPLVVLFPVAVEADTELFPVVTSSGPNILTIVSTIHKEGVTSTHLKYIYRYKTAFKSDSSPNHDGTCATTEFVRTTAGGDLVSFEASGTLNSGNALFGDTNSYGGSFDIGVSGPIRAYMLVTNSNASGTRENVGDNIDLGGEFVNMDVGSGAAWGGKGINNASLEDYDFVNKDDGGGVWSALPSNGFPSRRFAFFPADVWTTRFFVTPIGASMDSADHTATVELYTGSGLFDRNGTKHTFTPIKVNVTCTAAVDLKDLVESTVWAAVENLGGWGWLGVSANDAIVYKLEYAVNNPTYGGTNNNGFLFSSYDLP